MNIINDAMGGDTAPKEILLGAAAAVREYGVQITAVAAPSRISFGALSPPIASMMMFITFPPD